MWRIIIVLAHCLYVPFLPPCRAEKPVFTRSPKDSYPVKRKQLSLRCQAAGVPLPVITWFKDGQMVETQRDKPGTSNRITNHGELIFLSITPDDEGKYYCNATNVHGWTVSKAAVVKIAHFNSDRASGPQSMVVNVGDSVLLECVPPTGVPEPEVFWTKNSKRVLPSKRVNIQDSGSLRIDPAAEVDSGAYRCEAENPVDSWKSQDAALTVRRKRRIQYAPGSKQVFVGDTVEFQCMASEDPNSTIFWRREGGQIPKSSVLSRKSLRIQDVQLSYEGNYICEAKGTTAPSEAVAHLSVISPPSFLITPENLLVNEGLSVSLDCSVSGSPFPVLRWLHNEKTFWVPSSGETTYDRKHIRVYSNGTLVISSVSLKDEGLYVCKASQISRVVKSSAYISIKTRFAPIPVIEIGPQNQSLIVGMTATLPCHAIILRHPFHDTMISYPADGMGNSPTDLRIEWYINGIPASTVDDRRLLPFPSGSLQIISVRLNDSGTYTCRAVVDDFHNPVRSTSWSALVHVNDDQQSPSQSLVDSYDASLLPEPPYGVNVMSVGDTWIMLDILTSNSTNHGIGTSQALSSGFCVEIAEYNTSGWELAIPLTYAPLVQLRNLRPLTGYYISVRAVSHRGIGKPFILRRIVFTTQLVVGTEDPINLKVRLQEARLNSVKLRSLSPSEILSEWSVCSPVDATLFSGFRSVVRAVALSRCLKRDLNNGISIREEFALSELSNPDCLSAKKLFADDEHDLPHCSIGESSETTNLDRVPPQFLSKEDIHIGSFPSDDPSTVRILSEGLRPFTCYVIEVDGLVSVSASNRIFSKKSFSSPILTYDSPPSGAPRVISTRWVRNGTALDIVWHPPVEWEQGGILTGYVVRILSSSATLNQNIRLGPEYRTFQITNLDPWMNFTIYLAAVNCRGEGVRSLPILVFPYPQYFLKRELGRDVRYSHPMAAVRSDFPKHYPLHRRVIFDGREAVSEDTVTHEKHIASTLSNAVPQNKDSDGDALTREPWFVVSVIAFVLLWVLIVLGLIICGRYRSRRHRHRRENGDVGIITKNGRLVSPSDTCTPNFNPVSWPSNSIPESYPLVSAFDANYYPGEKSVMENTYSAMMNPAASGLLPGITFATSPSMINGSAQLPSAYCPDSSSCGVGQPSIAYVTSNNIPVNMPNPSLTGFTPVIGNNGNPDARLAAHRPVPMLPNGGLHLPSRYDAAASGKPSQLDLDKEDTVTPYASVPVMQQMVAFDRAVSKNMNPNTSGIKQNNINDHMGALQSAVLPVGRQLSLAEIIPPPPDYPPPSVPSGSPPPLSHSDRQTPSVWPRTAGAGSGSGEDSAYYAPHAALSQQTNFKSSTDASQHRTPPQWSCSLAASDESAMVLLPQSMSPYADSNICGNHRMMLSNTEHQANGIDS